MKTFILATILSLVLVNSQSKADFSFNLVVPPPDPHHRYYYGGPRYDFYYTPRYPRYKYYSPYNPHRHGYRYSSPYSPRYGW